VAVSVPAAEVVVQITGVVRSHQALRPLRLAALTVVRGERVAIHGVDAPAAEVFINLVTGATLPEQGEVRILGRATSEIDNGDEWLASLDRFGIVSPRAVMMDGATVLQNLAMPFTLNIDPVPAETIERVEALAKATGIPPERLGTAAGDLAGDVRVRVHLARAMALDPLLLLLEHPTAGVDEAAVPRLADDVARALEARGTTALIISRDETFASRTATRRLTLQPGTGQLKPARKGWFGR
jgi:ABC-type transporter Mla maintaining outer membrane lipid asymmetry ATPase subunit MlaF